MSKMLKTTELALAMLEKVINAKIHIMGKEFLDMCVEHPVVFVVNHFTRAETFILPYVMYKETKKVPHSLADGGLFHGRFGNFLSSMGAVATDNPNRDKLIISELMKGSHDWVIFPEGMMVKNKLTYENGKYIVSGPEEKRAPRSGAAVLALKATMYRKHYMNAIETGNQELKEYLENTFDFKGVEEISKKDIVIIPVNITYYPIRPGRNILQSVVLRFFKDMPKRVEEELEIEGNLLLKHTDINITFNRPFYPNEYILEDKQFLKIALDFLATEKQVDFTLWYQKRRLTEAFMKVIYESVTINFDHLFCTAIRLLRSDEILLSEFCDRIFVAALEINKLSKQIHDSIQTEPMVHIITDRDYQPLKSILELAVSEKTIILKDGFLIRQQENLNDEHKFHTIRVRNTIKVLSNEIEPLQDVVQTIQHNFELDHTAIKRKIVAAIKKLDHKIFDADYEKFYVPHVSKSKENGSPFYLDGTNKDCGIILSHGYLSAPAEVYNLAKYLNEKGGYCVYVIRLRGHGTSPENLAHVKWEQWYESYLRGVAVISSQCKKVVFGGFSSGGLVALLNAAKMGNILKGVFSINAPLKLNNKKAKFVPAVSFWNDLLSSINIHSAQVDYIVNTPENPDINYNKNYLKGVLQLSKMIDTCAEELSKINCPALIIQGDKDPTVNPISGQMIIDALGSTNKELVMLPFNRHVIVRKENSEVVFEKIFDFVKKIFETNP